MPKFTPAAARLNADILSDSDARMLGVGRANPSGECITVAAKRSLRWRRPGEAGGGQRASSRIGEQRRVVDVDGIRLDTRPAQFEDVGEWNHRGRAVGARRGHFTFAGHRPSSSPGLQQSVSKSAGDGEALISRREPEVISRDRDHLLITRVPDRLDALHMRTEVRPMTANIAFEIVFRLPRPRQQSASRVVQR